MERDEETHQMTVRFSAASIERMIQRRETRTRVIEVGPRGPRKPRELAAAPDSPAMVTLTAREPVVKPWMTLEQAEAYLGLPASVLGRMIEQGRLRALDVGVRAGGRWRVKRDDLDAIEGERVTPVTGVLAAMAAESR